MNAYFVDSSGVEALVSEEMPKRFPGSPEYLQALNAYQQRISKQ